MAKRAVCAPGHELAAAVELAVRGELVDPEAHPYLAGMNAVYVFDDQPIDLWDIRHET